MLFFGRRKIILVICILLTMAVTGWFWRHKESVPFVSQTLSTAAAPFEYTASQITFMGKTGISIIDQSVSKWSDLDNLRKENAGLKAEQLRYSEILAENIRMRNLLKFKQGYTKFNLLGASVIARDYGTWMNTLMIDRGTDSGIKTYMPVIVPQGVVGFVSEVYLKTARVQLVLDPRTTVGGIVQRPASRVASKVSGNSGKQGVLSFINIAKEADVIKGDRVVTSGYGGVYPKGLLIGTVENVSDDLEKVSLDADIRPAVDFGHLEEVFVITDSIQKSAPEDIDIKTPLRERPIDPNSQQVEGKDE